MVGIGTVRVLPTRFPVGGPPLTLADTNVTPAGRTSVTTPFASNGPALPTRNV
jgi:hypothetical protein